MNRMYKISKNIITTTLDGSLLNFTLYLFLGLVHLKDMIDVNYEPVMEKVDKL